MTLPILSNDLARRVFLNRHLLSAPPSGSGRTAELTATIQHLGFVQLDSVNTLARAHDLILWSRQNRYRPAALDGLLARDRVMFEHWTHDAAILPIEHFPHWRKRFAMDAVQLQKNWSEWRREGFMGQLDTVRQQITDHGACTSGDVGKGEARGSGGWWDWHPSKTALEYLWRTGELSVAKRVGFRKVYDLTERVIPPEYLNARHAPEDTINWACAGALDRLGFATSGELAAFWALVTPAEAKAWCAEALATGEIIEVEIEGHDGARRRSFGRPDLLDAAHNLQSPAARVRLLSPFDPALRDRKRAERLFGFHYRIEIFVPEAKRQYGYYVFPVWEGSGPIGRIDVRANRQAERLEVTAFWPEAGVKMGAARQKRLASELERVARLAGCSEIDYAQGWLRG